MIFGFFTWLINMFLLWILDDTPVKEVVKEVKPVIEDTRDYNIESGQYSIEVDDGFTITLPSLAVCKTYEVQYSGAKCVKK